MGGRPGAMLLFAVERAELEELLEADPYYRSTPGVEVRAIREWVPVVGG
ncbi:hypothetical protein ACIQJT_08940 [Streptomyces sp. NPDC091972]